VTTDTPNSDLQRAADLVRSADSVIALTGAGISTPSGIPDFRSPGSGLWERVNPMEVASILAFRYNPERFYEWMRPMADLILKAEPNPAHIALAQLEQSSHMLGLCFQSFSTNEMLIEFAESGRIPRCEQCNGILKPDAVLFGEQLPVDAVREAQRWIKNCDLLITAGSSLEVVPVALFPVDALNAGARLIIFNNSPTYVDDRADVIFRQDVAESLPQLVAEVLRE